MKNIGDNQREECNVTTISRPYLLLAVLLSTVATLIVLAR
jgi:hypothetical protein